MLADFGCSVWVGGPTGSKVLKCPIGSELFLPPEMRRYPYVISPLMDAWAFAVLLAICLTGKELPRGTVREDPAGNVILEGWVLTAAVFHALDNPATDAERPVGAALKAILRFLYVPDLAHRSSILQVIKTPEWRFLAKVCRCRKGTPCPGSATLTPAAASP